MFEFQINDKNFLPHQGCRIHFRLGSGSLTLLSGENGIGKTTLLKRILDQEQKHTLTIADQKPPDIFFDRNLASFRKILFSSVAINKDFFDRFWVKSELKKKEDRFLSQLSGGEAQLLKLLSVCASKADVFLLDEPGQNLDTEKKKLLNEMLLELKNSGKTLLVVEHSSEWLSHDSSIQLEIKGGELRVSS